MSGDTTASRRPPLQRFTVPLGVVPIFIVTLCVLVVALSPASPTAGSPLDRPTQSTSDRPRLELVEQRLAVDPDGDIELRYLLRGLDGDPLQLLPPPEPVPPTTPEDPALTPPDEPVEPVPPPPPPELVQLTLRITNYAALSDPDDVARLVGSRVDPDEFVGVIDGVEIDARPLLTLNDDGTVDLVLDVGTDVVDSVESRLKLERPGFYPLRIQLLVGDPDAGDVIATAGTVIQRVAGAVDSDAVVAPPIGLSVVTAIPGLAPSADDARLAAANEQLDAAVDLADALRSPMTLQVPPTLVADMASTPAGSERLATALADDELITLPIVPLDVSSAVAVGRADTYTRFISAGEDLLAEAVPTTPTQREVWIATDQISTGGAQHLRDLGTRLVVIPPELYRQMIGGELPPSDRFVEAELPDGGTLAFLLVDGLELTVDAADQILARSTATEWGVTVLTEMLVEQEADDAAAALSFGRQSVAPRRSRVLAAADLTSPDVRLLGALEQLAATTPGVRFTPASALPRVTDVLLDDGEPVTIQLPDIAGPLLDARVELLDLTGLDLASAASMLADDDPRVAEWSNQIDTLISTGFSDAEVDAATSAMIAEADTLRQAVRLPDPFTFTLTGRSGTIEVRIANTLDEPLDVIVSLDSTKVDFPEGDQRVTLRPLDETSVIVPVDAEANGTSSIELTVSTPAGEPIGEPVALTARVTALTGLGQVLTGGFVLVLLTWWFTHWRGRRRTTVEAAAEPYASTDAVQSDAL